MRFPKLTKWLIWSLCLLIFSQCTSDSITQNASQESVVFEWTGPLYEGSNPSQQTIKVDLPALLGKSYQEGMEIVKVSLQSAELSADSSTAMNGINSLVLSIASDDPSLPMKELAVLNPVQAGLSQASLKTSPEAEVADFFGQKQFYLVVDAGLSADRDADLRLTGKFKWEIQFR